MGVLSKSRLRWGEAFRGDESLMEEAGPNKVRLRLAGEVHEGSVFAGRHMSIHWADGVPGECLPERVHGIRACATRAERQLMNKRGSRDVGFLVSA
ncbi:unnamed protein product [Symbiodinium pilosum]|uniref:Uncharacterized protein n=1 Tax=Symbiodinium pilosum TaxID=2952 RepID=A0A812TRQ9_SYMPI|nr:unnamed protein product [Symbiodinium pilosum]